MTTPIDKQTAIKPRPTLSKITVTEEGTIRLPNGREYSLKVSRGDNPNAIIRLSEDEQVKIAKKVAKMLNETKEKFQDLTTTIIDKRGIQSGGRGIIEMSDKNKERYKNLTKTALKTLSPPPAKKEALVCFQETTLARLHEVNSLKQILRKLPTNSEDRSEIRNKLLGAKIHLMNELLKKATGTTKKITLSDNELEKLTPDERKAYSQLKREHEINANIDRLKREIAVLSTHISTEKYDTDFFQSKLTRWKEMSAIMESLEEEHLELFENEVSKGLKDLQTFKHKFVEQFKKKRALTAEEENTLSKFRLDLYKSEVAPLVIKAKEHGGSLIVGSDNRLHYQERGTPTSEPAQKKAYDFILAKTGELQFNHDAREIRKNVLNDLLKSDWAEVAFTLPGKKEDLEKEISRINFLSEERLYEALLHPSNSKLRNEFLLSYGWFIDPKSFQQHLSARFDQGSPKQKKIILDILHNHLAKETPVTLIRPTELDKPDQGMHFKDVRSTIEEVARGKIKKDKYDEAVAQLADDLATLDANLFAAIQGKEFVNCRWKKEDANEICPNITQMIDQTNKVTNMVQRLILNTNLKSKERAKMMEFFLDLQTRLVEIGDFHGAMSVHAALSSNEIDRLTKAWGKISKEHKKKKNDLESLFAPTSNYGNLSKHMVSARKARIPALPQLLVQLTGIHEGNTSWNDHNEMSLDKVQLLGDFHEKVAEYQQKLTPKQTLTYDLLYETKKPAIPNTDLYNASLEIQPRKE